MIFRSVMEETGGGSTAWVQNTFTLYLLLDLHVVTSYGEIIKFGRVSLLEMTHSAHVSQCVLYVGFGYADLKSGCDPTENVPSWCDRVCNLVWYNDDTCASLSTPISFTCYPVSYPDFHIKIPTNLGPG